MIPALAWFAPQLFFGRVGYFRDTGLYFQPHRALIAAALRAGHLPQWNRFEYGGVPLLADPNFNTFHPLSLLVDLLPLPFGFGLMLFACALLAAYGGRALGRALGLGRSGALACGLFFAWSGPTVSFLLTGQAVASCALPWLCAAGARLGAARSLGALLACAVAAALVLLSGTPEVGACAFALAAALALSEGAPRAAASAALFMLASLLGGALAAIQLFPTALFLRASSRAAGFSLSHALSYSLHPLRAFELLLPFFSGDVDGPGASSWLLAAADPPYVQQIYVGAGVLLLALLGLRARGARRRLPLLLLALTAAMLAFGSYLPFYDSLWRALPPLHIVRFPEKLIVPLSLALAVSAGAGWERLCGWLDAVASREALARRALLVAGLLLALCLAALVPELWAGGLLPRLGTQGMRSLEGSALSSLGLACALGAVASLLLVLGVRGRMPAARVRLGMALLLCIELAVPALRLDRTAPSGSWPGRSPLAKLLEADARAPLDTFRVSTQPAGLDTPQLDLLAARLDAPRSLALHQLRETALYDASAALAGVRSDRGYSGFTPGALQRLYQQAQGADALDLLSVRYAVEFGFGRLLYTALGFEFRPELTDAIAAASGFPPGVIRVLENRHAMPLAWLAPAVLLGDGEGIAPRCGGLFVPWLPEATANSLPAELPRGRSCAELAAFSSSAPGTATLASIAAERLALTVEAASPALLVLGESALPGWRAFVDAIEVPMLSADAGLRSCAVPAGRHAVSFTYEAPGLRAGALTSALALLLALALFAIERLRARPVA